jgi:predicted  nucleic acid-binding Zn-ribbon protein
MRKYECVRCGTVYHAKDKYDLLRQGRFDLGCNIWDYEDKDTDRNFIRVCSECWKMREEPYYDSLYGHRLLFLEDFGEDNGEEGE